MALEMRTAIWKEGGREGRGGILYSFLSQQSFIMGKERGKWRKDRRGCKKGNMDEEEKESCRQPVPDALMLN